MPTRDQRLNRPRERCGVPVSRTAPVTIKLLSGASSCVTYKRFDNRNTILYALRDTRAQAYDYDGR
jgi:hypothetical protein